jgi:F-type H+-transporting ATPase subunit b
MDSLLDAFGINGQLLIAQAVNFGVLLVALWYFLYRPVMKTLDARAKKIAQGVEDAERAGQKLASADIEAAEAVAKADAEASEIVASARTAGTSEKTRIVKEAEARAVSIAADAEARATEAAAKTLRDSEKEIARLAVLAAAKAMAQGREK